MRWNVRISTARCCPQALFTIHDIQISCACFQYPSETKSSEGPWCSFYTRDTRVLKHWVALCLKCASGCGTRKLCEALACIPQCAGARTRCDFLANPAKRIVREIDCRNAMLPRLIMISIIMISINLPSFSILSTPPCPFITPKSSVRSDLEAVTESRRLVEALVQSSKHPGVLAEVGPGASQRIGTASNVWGKTATARCGQSRAICEVPKKSGASGGWDGLVRGLVWNAMSQRNCSWTG